MKVKRPRGFTLIELLVVVGIISILAIVALPNFETAQKRAKLAAVKNNMRQVALKLEMLNVDTNFYPLVGKWRLLMYYTIFTRNIPDGYAWTVKLLDPLYGPHQDTFEQTWLQMAGLYDSEWLANINRRHLFNGFMFFFPRNTLRGIDRQSLDWQDCQRENWQAALEAGGEWMLYSGGPDLIAETPSWIWTNLGGYRELQETGYVERRIFTQYDPTNGTVSYGNLFRSQKNTAGLDPHPRFYSSDDESGAY